jgi:hypothetical protein
MMSKSEPRSTSSVTMQRCGSSNDTPDRRGGNDGCESGSSGDVVLVVVVVVVVVVVMMVMVVL